MEIGKLIDSEVKEKLKQRNPLSHKKKEKLSKWELEELMGVNNPTYKKVKGRYRQYE